MANNSNKNKCNVPHLRFPEFSGEWEKNNLSKFSSKITKKNKGNVIQNVLCNSANLGIIPQNDYFDRDIANADNTDSYYIIEQGDFVYNPRKSTAAPYGPVNIYNGEKPGIISPLYLCFSVLNISPSFLFYRFKSSVWHPYVYSHGDTGVRFDRVSIKDDVFFDMPIYTPTQNEQEKIATLLSLIDERIATQNKIIEDLKKLKSAIIEKLYSDIKGREYSYRQIFEIVNERNKQLEYLNILSASQEKGMVNREDLNLDIQFERSNINTYKIVKEGDYVIHLRSFQGGFAFSDKHGVCSPAYTILRPNDLLEFRYLSYYFTSQRFIKSLIVVTYGIRDGRSINVEEWLDMKTIIPSKERQHHIVETIRNIENKIENEEKYASCLSNQKQYLLHHLFI
ncbi:restriction endonuclease subunit S [Bacteroides caecimuris]|uniref:restriction endonuclease subunit S n=1 Tax=Bacteroides caecimuris TaxID=1796613 RepID=UPI00321FC0B4